MSKYWVASSDSSFSSTNWSLSSGGPSGSPVPGPSDSVFFDGGGTGSCNLDTSVNIAGLNVSIGYPGTIIQGLNGINIGLDASFNGGTFDGTSSPITIQGSLFLGPATDFTSTSDVLTLYGSFSSAQDSFVHNDGTFKMGASGTLFQPNGTTFNTLAFDMTSAGFCTVDTSSTVETLLLLSRGQLNHGVDGTFNLLGDVSCGSGFGKWDNSSNVQIKFTSGYFQNIITSGGILPIINVDKTTQRPLKFFGDTVYIDGDFIITDGTVNTNGTFLQVGKA
jgi:hypothetical protein